jgi:hypothetical protein
VALIEADGRQLRSYSVSGKANVPRPGTYHVFSKSRVSSAGSLRLDHMVRFVPGDKAIGFHAIRYAKTVRPSNRNQSSASTAAAVAFASRPLTPRSCSTGPR